MFQYPETRDIDCQVHALMVQSTQIYQQGSWLLKRDNLLFKRLRRIAIGKRALLVSFPTGGESN